MAWPWLDGAGSGSSVMFFLMGRGPGMLVRGQGDEGRWTYLPACLCEERKEEDEEGRWLELINHV